MERSGSGTWGRETELGNQGGTEGNSSETPVYPTDTPPNPRTPQISWGHQGGCRGSWGCFGVPILTQMKGLTAAQGNQPRSPLATFLP